eukprot:PhF_6_TR29205/c0_g1_i1/m.42730
MTCTGLPPWVVLHADGNLFCQPRFLHTANAVQETIYLIGGKTLPVRIVESYSPGTSRWNQHVTSGQLPFEYLHSHTTVCHGQYLIVFGGTPEHCNCTNALLRLDTTSLQWVCAQYEEGCCPEPRFGHSACQIQQPGNNNVYMCVFAGCSAENSTLDDLWILNCESALWRRLDINILRSQPSQSAGRFYHTMNWFAAENKLIVFGGNNWAATNSTFVADMNVDLENPGRIVCNVWFVSSNGFVPIARCNHTSIIHNGRIHVFGGRESSTANGKIDVTDAYSKFLARDQNWVRVSVTSHFPSSRWGHAAAICGDAMYIFGGSQHMGKVVNDAYKVRLVAVTKCVWD